MTSYQILSLCGIGTLCSLIITLLFNLIVNYVKKKKDKSGEVSTDLTLLKTGIQALLRNNLYAIHREWMPRGWCPTDVKDNFENMYNQYHQLGANGVMDRVREELMDLPTINPEK